MNEVTLGIICEINPRKPQGLDPESECSFIPMDHVDDYFGLVSKMSVRRVSEVENGYTFFQDGDVLFAKITPCMENGKCAIARNLVNRIGFGSTEFHVVRARGSVIPEWIYYYLRQESVRKKAEQSMTGSAGQRRVPSKFLEEALIPLPPLPQQQRIAAMLAKADRLRRLRRTACELSDTYLQSVFVHLFGDPGVNPHKWDIAPVERALSRRGTQTGPFGSSLKRNEYVKQGIPVWGIDNVRENKFTEQGSLFITPAKYHQLSRYTVEDGDILVSRAGTVGRMCVAHPTQSPSIIGTNLVRVAVDTSAILPEYFTALFTYFSDRIESMSSGGTAYSFVNPRTLKLLKIPIPPITLQQQFAHIVHKFEHLRAQQREAERQAEHLFQSLLQRAFRGGL